MNPNQGQEETLFETARARDHSGAEQWYRQMEQESKTADLDQLAWRWATAAIPEARDGPAAVRFALKAVANDEQSMAGASNRRI